MGDPQDEKTPKSNPAAGSSFRKLVRRPLVALLVVAVLLIVNQVVGGSPPAPSGSASAGSAEPKPPRVPAKAGDAIVLSEDDIASIEDAVVLQRDGRYHLEKGDKELAKKCFVAATQRAEMNLYTSFAGEPWAEAVVAEQMGELDEAEKIWRKGIEQDPLFAYTFLVRFSQHPKRKELLEATKAHVLDVVARAKAGENAVIYVTSKGDDRYLEVKTQEEAMEAFLSGEGLKYTYIEEVDLTGKTWPKEVGCHRCVIGSVKGWDATFEDQLYFKAFILGDFHIGKHWTGKVNASPFDPPARVNRLYLRDSVFLGKVDMDSVKVTGRVANLPFVTFTQETNLRNMEFEGVAEFRYAHFTNPVSLKSARFRDSAYFSYAQFAGGLDLSRARTYTRPIHFASASFDGDFLVEEAIFAYPITFENAHFDGSVTIRRSRFDDQLHLSRARITGDFAFQSNEAKDLFMFGAQVEGNARFDSCYFVGRALFSLDELTRREHLNDVRALHKSYKIYQGDDDAEEDLTKSSQYGVTHVNDLVSRFEGEVSFANTYFRQFVGFERVVFGTEAKPGYANFYNTQFGGEAHFERATFHGVADFRTVGGTELSFNQTRFYSHWMLDDANVPGRLSTNETDLIGDDATVSIAGADIRSFGIEYRQILKDPEEEWKTDNHRLFYERCLEAFKEGKDTQRYIDDRRLVDAKWNAEGTERLTDESAIAERARSMCINRAVDEYVRLKASFDARSMSDQSDWAYWHVKHHGNHRSYVSGGFFGKVSALGEKMLFEKGFGWGVLLGNLAVTSLVVIVFFAMLTRLLCGDMEVIWDEQPCHYRDLTLSANLVISMHSFLGGFGNSEALVTDSSTVYKWLFTAEIMAGIIIITFFIGAYTSLVLG